MSDLEVALAGQSLADYTKAKLMTALGTPTYTSVGDMWYKYLISEGYTGSFTDMLNKFYVDASVPLWARNPYNASVYIP
jgi:hypothetical protein